MNDKITHILTQIAQENAPHVLHHVPTTGADRANRLAHELVREGIMLLWSEFLPATNSQTQERLIAELVDRYARLYRVITDAFFAPLNAIEATYAEGHFSPFVVLKVACAPVLQMLAGYIAPYVALRQKRPLNVGEVRGMMDYILKDLVVNNAPQAVQERVIQDSMVFIGDLLALPLTHRCLTSFKKPLFGDVGDTPTEILPRAQVIAPPPPPISAPAQEPPAKPPARPLSIPIFFEPSQTKHEPPVPPLPKKPKKD